MIYLLLALCLFGATAVIVFLVVLLARCTAALSAAVKLAHRDDVRLTNQAATIAAYMADNRALRAELATVRPPF